MLLTSSGYFRDHIFSYDDPVVQHYYWVPEQRSRRVKSDAWPAMEELAAAVVQWSNIIPPGQAVGSGPHQKAVPRGDHRGTATPPFRTAGVCRGRVCRGAWGPPPHCASPCVSVGGAIYVGCVDATRRPLRRPCPHRHCRSASCGFRVVARTRGSPRASAVPPAPSVPTAGHDGVPLPLPRHGAAAALL